MFRINYFYYPFGLYYLHVNMKKLGKKQNIVYNLHTGDKYGTFTKSNCQ